MLAHYYLALNTDLLQQDPGLSDVSRRALSLGISVRPLCMDRLREELTGVHALTIECFRDAFLFAPICRDDFLAHYLELSTKVQPGLILLAEQSGRLIGFIFAVPDLLQAGRGVAIDTMVIKTLAVHPEFRGTGVGRLLAARCHEAAYGLGIGVPSML